RRHLPDRGRLRDGSRRREVLRHQVPRGGAEARRRPDRGDGESAQVPRRRAPAGRGQGRRRGAPSRARQPGSAHCLRPPVQGAGAGRAQPLPDGHRARVPGGRRPLRHARRAGLRRRRGRRRRGRGGEDLARGLLKVLEAERSAFEPLYPLDATVKDKLETIATRIYGADGVDYAKKVDRQIAQAEALGYGRMPVCVAKTQRSLSDDPTLLNRPLGFRITINDVRISAGAGFLVALAGDITTMPGLPRKPNAEGVDLTPDGIITGLF